MKNVLAEQHKSERIRNGALIWALTLALSFSLLLNLLMAAALVNKLSIL